VNLREAPDIQRIVQAYFEELDAALARLPRDRRATLVSEIRCHVDDAIAEQRPSSVTALRELLARVGAPGDIAAAALDEEDDPQPRHGRRALLIAGAAAVAAVGIGLGVALALAPGGRAHPATQASGAGGSRNGGHATGSPSTTIPRAPTGGTSPTPSTSTAPAATTTPSSTSVPRSFPAAPVSSVASGALSVLTPATVPPSVPECTRQLQFGADGSAGPLLCPNGDINVLAWRWYATGLGANTSPFTVMALGPDATPVQVGQAMCADLPRGSIPTVTDAYHLAVAYYGWSFGYDLSQNLVLGDLCSAG
jgi:hypothetical protein